MVESASPKRLNLLKRLLKGAFFALLVFNPAISPAAGVQPAIASAHPLATEAGMQILAQGGNAFDAAVAVSAALAVVEPQSSGLGGGGFWLLHRADSGEDVMIDGREKAPLAARRDMYLDERGEIIEGRSIDGPLAAGIPGEPAALAHIAERYGQLPLSRSLAPAIRLAREGFPVDARFRRMAAFRLEALRRGGSATNIFLRHGAAPDEGELIRQPELAETLWRLGHQGRDGFYAGKTARRLVEGVRKAGGIWTQKDLSDYRIVEREPVVGRYRDLRVTAASLPSSGGIVLMEMLNQLQGMKLAGLDEAGLVHAIVETMRRAYRDRAEYLGDPDFVPVPVKRLLSADHARALRKTIHPDKATPSADLKAAPADASVGRDTTHFSIIDRQGNRVAATLSINYPFGSGFVAPGTGVLLNDEMDDFSAKPGAPNVYGLVGGQANAIAPGKRMLSSMTPTFLESPNRVAILGTPGGSRIITMALLATLAFDQGASAEDMVALRRFHHQYLPDVIEYEEGAISPAARAKLEKMGHALKPFQWVPGDMQVVILDKRTGHTHAASDPRGAGESLVAPADPVHGVLDPGVRRDDGVDATGNAGIPAGKGVTQDRHPIIRDDAAQISSSP